jgi:multiple antibiotic resistance protein
MNYFNFIVTIWLKFFFLFTPFFALTMFLAMTRDSSEQQRRKLALQITGAVGALCFILYFFGNMIFTLFGITVDAFRVGAGSLLFLTGIQLAQFNSPPATSKSEDDIAVVPLAMPIIVGPATIGTLLVFGAEIPDSQQKGLGCIALFAAIVSVGIILMLGSLLERLLGQRGLNILTKITGLILSAMAAQMILTGAHHILMGK